MTNAQSDFQVKLSKGHAALWDHDWAGAIQAYNDALIAVPDNPSVLASLGLALFHQKSYSESLRIFQKLARENPLDPMPMERIARIYEREGLLQEAARSFYQAGELQLKNRDLDRAFADYRAMLRFDPQNQTVRARMGMVFSKLGKKKEAVAEFIDLAALVQRDGDDEKAAQILEYASQINPESQEVKNARAALTNMQRIPLREIEPEVSGALRMAQVREIETAQTAPDSLESHDPITEARLNALEAIADVLFEENDTVSSQNPLHPSRVQGAGLEFSTGHLTVDQKNIQLHIGHAIDLHTASRNDEAAAELEKTILAGLNLPAVSFLLGLLLSQDDPEKSLQYLQRTLNDPSYALASRLISGELSLNGGMLSEATSHYLYALMLADCETVPEEQALELYQLYEPILESRSLITQEKDMRNLCAAISGQLNRQDWRRYMQEARKQLPKQPEGAPPLPLVEMLIDANSSRLVDSLTEMQQLIQQGKHRTAMEESYRAITYAPNYLPLHIQMGEILINEGRVVEAIEKFLIVTRLYMIRNDNTSALRLLTRVTRLAPMDITVRKTLIELLRLENNFDELIRQYMELANVHYLLADLVEARRAYHTALNLSRQLRSGQEQSLKILNRLADIELQSLNWKEAVLVYEQIRSLLPLDPAPRLALVDLYYRLNLEAAAINELDAFLKLLEAEQKTQEIEKFLDDLLLEHPDNIEIQRRLAAFCVTQGQLVKAVAKLDALAEKLMVEKNITGSAEVISQIIALDPPNRVDYERLYQEITKKQ
jgi:tetratricopeptide (TPR) repeat protein